MSSQGLNPCLLAFCDAAFYILSAESVARDLEAETGEASTHKTCYFLIVATPGFWLC